MSESPNNGTAISIPSHALSTGAAAGIAVGIVLGGVLISASAFLAYRRCRTGAAAEHSVASATASSKSIRSAVGKDGRQSKRRVLFSGAVTVVSNTPRAAREGRREEEEEGRRRDKGGRRAGEGVDGWSTGSQYSDEDSNDKARAC